MVTIQGTACLPFRKLLLAGVAALPFAAFPAFAQQDSGVQDPGTDEQPAVSEAVEESGPRDVITVTARRREESLQDVPISVSAFTGDQLERVGAEDITYLTQVIPNLTLEVSRGTNTTITAFIRGVGQQDPVAGFESGVGIYVDDVYFNRPQAAVLDIFDVERVEVLRGPQGTLYGRNTIGGAIKYVTRRLGDEPELDFRLSVGTYGQLDGVVSASLPLTDTLRVGGAIASFNRDGFGENLNLDGIENYHRQVLAARARVEWTPTDSLFFRVAGDWVEDDSDPRQGHRLTVGNLSGAPVLDNEFDTRAGLNNPTQNVTAQGISFLAEWQINDVFTLKNIIAYREDESFSPIDFDSLPTVDLDVPVVYENDQFSEELQLLFETDWVSGILGFYYLDATAFNAFDVILGATGDLIGLPGFNSFTLGDVETETWSVFGDVTFDLMELLNLSGPFMHGLEVSLGGRYTEDERTSRILRQNLIGGTSSFFGGDAVPIATTSDFRGTATFDDFTPRASIAWYPHPSHNLYFTYSEGFKGGSFDPRGLSSAAPDLDGDGVVDDSEIFDFLLFDPETVDSYEFGLKSSWLEGRVTTNLAIFFANYEDVQIPGSVGLDSDGDGIDDQFIGITSNAADADIFGVELEGNALIGEDWIAPGDFLNLAWTFGYIDPEFNTFIDALGNDVADERVFQNTPNYTASGTLTYQHPLDFMEYEGAVSWINTVSYRGDHSQFEAPNPFLDQESYYLWDMSLVWEADNGRLRAGIHGRNLLDERYKVAGYFFPTLGLESTITAFYGNPRTVTGTLDISF